jgi:hypothetical protein
MNTISENPLIKRMYTIHYNLNNYNILNTTINPYDYKNNDDDINPNNDCDYFYEYSSNP